MKDKETLVGEKTHDFESLVSLTEILRSPDGCPWDREQTHKSVRPCLIEEAYEVCEAIDTDNAVLMREELGDLMFQVMFHAEIEKEKGTFDIGGVIDGICAKMIARHPTFSEAHWSPAARRCLITGTPSKKKKNR